MDRSQIENLIQTAHLAAKLKKESTHVLWETLEDITGDLGIFPIWGILQYIDGAGSESLEELLDRIEAIGGKNNGK